MQAPTPHRCSELSCGLWSDAITHTQDATGLDCSLMGIRLQIISLKIWSSSTGFSTFSPRNGLAFNFFWQWVVTSCWVCTFLLLLMEASTYRDFPGGSNGRESACDAEDLGSISGSGRSPGEGHGNPLQDSCLETHMDRRAWGAAVHGVAKSWTRLSD